MQQVLRAATGDTLRIGILDGPQGVAHIDALAPDAVHCRCAFDAHTEPRPTDALVLAIPRPNIAERCLAHAAALGFGTIVLVRTQRVEKSHLDARVLQPESIRRHLISGLEQARRTHLPAVHVERRFRPFVEDRLDALLPPTNRVLAHPDATQEVTALDLLRGAPLTLAIGPEGGFIPHETELLTGRGFTAARAGLHPLRVETALAFVTGQLFAQRIR
ncbi:MAG: 16S rRNA (uracil(1498)-N(3))-methyltransferase [Planctomycetes bacterium]|nr:16S rRNA (uracil(1498)-N(3))-methyltransferase [Planctomycetota bacterium]MCB9871862.1 16S rRNA (uracil(1498)-N(3))-methyltransferase [Planctomycetota bacterium]